MTRHLDETRTVCATILEIVMQTAREFRKSCRAYVSRTDDVVLISAFFNHVGAYMEMPGSVSACSATDTERVGQLVQEKLDACRFEPIFDHRGMKKSDWPAYQASGMKTMAAFERRFVIMTVDGLHFETSQWEATSPQFFNGSRLRSLAPNTPGARGEWLIELARFFIEVEKKTESP